MADALSATTSAFARDDDPEFVRIGAPSTLKMVEMLIEEQPEHPGLLLTACSGYTQYAYAFLHVESEITEPANPAAAADLKQRASRMYARAGGYCLRALAVHGAIGAGGPDGQAELRERLAKDPRAALAGAEPDDVPVLYWTAAAWGGSLAVADNPLLRLGELAGVRALFQRALALDETWEAGAIHEALIAIEGLPAIAGGSAPRARAHFDRAVELSRGQSAFAYVTLASSVAHPARDRAEFERLLRQALAIDAGKRPSARLANLVAQKRARFLLARASRLF
jgi:TRAP transporter T-component